MAKIPTVLCGVKNRLMRLVAGLVFASIILTCLVFPEVVFADRSIVALRAAVESGPSEDSMLPKLPHQCDALGQEQLVASLMQDVVVDAHKNIEADGHWKVVRMRVTGYCPCSRCCGAFSDGVTANNHRIQPGDRFVAADKSYPFGTEMVIPGYNASQSVQVMDRGGAIKGTRLDLFFHTHQQALQWGVQYLDVLVKTE